MLVAFTQTLQGKGSLGTPFLLLGSIGSGKTSILSHYLSSITLSDGSDHAVKKIALSAAVTPRT
jgi:hypothetical protein